MVKKSPFVKLAFAGSRFEGARLPADASVNISIYQEILIELAKQIWREKNPNRLRLPRNFDKYFQLQLGRIKDGSAVAHLPRYKEDLPPLFGTMEPGDIFDLAQDKLVRIVDCANEKKELPRLSAVSRSKISKLRSNLRSGEDLIVTRGRQSRSEDFHRISSITKANILSSFRERRTESIDGIGIVSGVQDSPASVSVTSEHGLLNFPVKFQTAKKVFAGKNGHLAAFNIIAQVDYDRNVQRIESVNSLRLTEEDSAMRQAVDRVENLSGLEDGWLDGAGTGVGELTILYARDIARFATILGASVGIFPALDGSVTMEYTRNELEWTVSVFNHSVTVEVLSLENDESILQRFKGASSSLMRVLLSENGISDG